MNTLNKDKLLELAKEAGVNIHEYVNDPGTPATVSYEFTAGGLKRFAALLSAAQEEREPATYQSRMLPNFDGNDWRAWEDCSKERYEEIKSLGDQNCNQWIYEARALYLAPPSSDQVWKYCPECGCEEWHPTGYANGRFCDECGQEWFPDIDYTNVVRSHLGARSLKRPLQAQEPECNGQCFKCECGRMPTQADPSASGAADSQPSPVTDELPPLPAPMGTMELNWGTPYAKDIDAYDETQMRGYAISAISRAQAAQQPLDNIEQYRLQMAAISTAALGYWKLGDPIKEEYVTVALKDVAKLYAKYDELFKAAQQAQAVSDDRKLLEDAWDRMDRARRILTKGNPKPDCSWSMLDTSVDRALLSQPAAPVSEQPDKSKLHTRLKIIYSAINRLEHKTGLGGANFETVQEQLEAIIRDFSLPPLPSFENSLPCSWVRNGIVIEPRFDEHPASQTANAVPEGWKLVPIEPTSEMMQAGFDVPGSHLYGLTYRAMLAAAPQPVAGQKGDQS